METTNIHLSNFEGPLDLLLLLVKNQDVDIWEVNLVELTNSYVKLVGQMKNQDLDLAARYLVIAVTLLNLKAKLLLDEPQKRTEVAEEKEVLLNKLVELQRFKQVAAVLRTKEEQREHIYIKEHEEVDAYLLPVDDSKLDGFSSVSALAQNLERMFERTFAQTLHKNAVKAFHFSPKERREQLLKLFATETKPLGFKQVFDVPSVNHFVVTVITVLDMVKKGEITIKQRGQFGTMLFERNLSDE